MVHATAAHLHHVQNCTCNNTAGTLECRVGIKVQYSAVRKIRRVGVYCTVVFFFSFLPPYSRLLLFNITPYGTVLYKTHPSLPTNRHRYLLSKDHRPSQSVDILSKEEIPFINHRPRESKQNKTKKLLVALIL